MKVLKILLISTFFGFWFLFFNFGSSATVTSNEASKSAFPELGFADKPARELYAQNCARCHGSDGQGKTELGATFGVPNIADAGWQSKRGDAKITRKIIKGGGGMPAFSKKLSAKEISSLVVYVRTLKK